MAASQHDNGWVARVNPTGTALDWATYLTGTAKSFFDALHLSAILRGPLNHLLGDQPADLLFLLKPPPEPNPDHREDRNPEDSHDQQRFLVGEEFDHAVIHVNLLARCRSIARCGDAIQ